MRSQAFAAGLVVWMGAPPSLMQKAPAPADLLFEVRDLQAAPLDASLFYQYQLVSALASKHMHGFPDTIRLLITPGAAAEARSIQVEIFSNTQPSPAGPFDDVMGIQ